MPTIVQLYILTAVGYIILSHSLRDILAHNFLKTVFLLAVYAVGLRVVLGLNPELPYFFQASVFLAYALFAPAAYLYLRNFVHKTSFRETDFIHIIPFLIVAIYGAMASATGVNLHQSLKEIWSFSSFYAYDSEVLMPLFLLIYCVTAFYFYRVLLLIKDSMAKGKVSVKLDEIAKVASSEPQSEMEENIHQHLTISEERMLEMDVIVREVLENKKPYLQQRYSLKDLAYDTQIPLHHLSAFINKHCGKNFNDFINEFRVLYCKEKIMKEEYKYKKLEAIAEESGFNNRNTFAIAFRKVTGVNPSEFLRALKSTQYEKPGTITEGEFFRQVG
jgi:AraC-like DNA-binding protein